MPTKCIRSCTASSSTYVTGVNSDHLSKAMLYFLHEAEKLVDVPGCAGIVFDLVEQLGDYSYGDLDYDTLSGYGDRPSDEILDNMLQALALPRCHEDPDWDYLSVLEALKRKAEYLDQFGIKCYCVQNHFGSHVLEDNIASGHHGCNGCRWIERNFIW